MELVALIVYGFFVLCLIAAAVACLAAWVHGLILAFRASIILGIVGLFVEPAFIIFGLVKWITGDDLAQKIVDYFSD